VLNSCDISTHSDTSVVAPLGFQERKQLQDTCEQQIHSTTYLVTAYTSLMTQG
jgi:hypothetical protein